MKTKKMIISFMLFILLMPTISSLLSLGNALTINENRTKEDFPDISALEGQGLMLLMSGTTITLAFGM